VEENDDSREIGCYQKEYTELEEQVRNIMQHMLRLEGAFQVLTDLSQELEEEVVAEEVSVEEVE